MCYSELPGDGRGWIGSWLESNHLFSKWYHHLPNIYHSISQITEVLLMTMKQMFCKFDKFWSLGWWCNIYLDFWCLLNSHKGFGCFTSCHPWASSRLLFSTYHSWAGGGQSSSEIHLDSILEVWGRDNWVSVLELHFL